MKCTLVLFAAGFALATAAHAASKSEPAFTDTFAVDKADLASSGANRYFVLTPGWQLVLEGKPDGKKTVLTITVLNETKLVDGVETRVVEEKKTENGQLIEISRNYFAISRRTNDAFYFGEDVDIYKNGKITSHDRFADEYQPFGVGLDEWDRISVTEFLIRAGASDAAIKFIGLSQESALQEMWTLAFFHRRGRHDVLHKDCFRVQGGNQRLTDAFAAKLGDRIKLHCPVTRLRRGDGGVTVYFEQNGEEKSLEAEYLVCGIPLPAFSTIPSDPAWPETKQWIMQNVPYSVTSRIVFQCRTRFWRQDGIVPNLATPDSPLHDGVWEMAHEVPGERGLLMAGARAGVTDKVALDELKRHYPGKLGEIEKVVAKHWYLEKWAPRCERTPFQIGDLSKFWPHIIQPVGRVHFVGSGVDNGPGGQEAATRSAHRVATAIDAA